jgi:hypothetical protein
MGKSMPAPPERRPLTEGGRESARRCGGYSPTGAPTGVSEIGVAKRRNDLE